jgi:PAS domain-containing protein
MEDKIIFVNKALSEAYRYEEEDIVGANSSILGESDLKGEFYHRRKDGNEFPVSLTRSVIKDENGNEVAIVGITRDITELKLAEKVLRDSFAQLAKKNRYETVISTITRSVHQSINLQEVLENAVEAVTTNLDGVDNVAIYLVEEEAAVLKAYRGFRNWFLGRVRRIPYPIGLTWKTIIEGKSEYVPDVDEDAAFDHDGREGGISSYLSMPIHFEGKSVGSIHIGSFQKNAFDEEETKVLEIVVQQIEIAINNANQAEALRKSEEKYRDLVDQINEGIFIHDNHGVITFANQTPANIHGFKGPEEMLGRMFTEFVSPNVGV